MNALRRAWMPLTVKQSTMTAVFFACATLLLVTGFGCAANRNTTLSKPGPPLASSRWKPGAYTFVRLVDLMKAKVVFNKDGTLQGDRYYTAVFPGGWHWDRWTDGSQDGKPTIVLTTSENPNARGTVFYAVKGGRTYIGYSPDPFFNSPDPLKNPHEVAIPTP